ncbi:hypothetical protein [Citrobacter freundii]|uniref:hypothetical protein n=1 Tax=Citrobacter freundii TaxID=546 RepID=UPI00300D91BE
MTALNKQALRMRNYLDMARKSGATLLHLTTDELSGLLDELEKEKGYASAYEGEKWHYHQLAESEGERANRAETKLEAAEKRIAELQSDAIAPGIMRCAGCGFVLTKNNINMAAGTITAGDSKTEPCPNGCGPLWPVTWKEQALQMRDDSESWFLELQDAKKHIAELEARTVNLPAACADDEYFIDGVFQPLRYERDVERAIRAAGIGVKGE